MSITLKAPRKLSSKPLSPDSCSAFSFSRVVTLFGCNVTKHLSRRALRQILSYGGEDLPNDFNRTILELTLHSIHETGRFD